MKTSIIMLLIMCNNQDQIWLLSSRKTKPRRRLHATCDCSSAGGHPVHLSQWLGDKTRHKWWSGTRTMHCSLAWSPRMHVTDRVSCSETARERLLLLLLWGLNQPHNGLWDLCHCRVTAVELGGRQRRIATRTQRSIYTDANHSADLLTTDKANIELLQRQVQRRSVEKCIMTLAALDLCK